MFEKVFQSFISFLGKKAFHFIAMLSILTSLGLSSCKKEEMYAFKGTVTDIHDQPVANARIQVFNSPNDWLTGLNVIATFSSDLNGNYESGKMFQEKEYYLFIEKYDSNNWNYRDVEGGEYPIISLPIDGQPRQVIERNNMSLLANTNWTLTNVLKEYSISGEEVKEWRSVWTEINNCRKDNYIHFGKDLSMLICEGQQVCSGTLPIHCGTFVPPIIFTALGCQKLLHTSQNVKPFEYSDWPEMEAKNAEMFLSCNPSSGYLYVVYEEANKVKRLLVYSRF